MGGFDTADFIQNQYSKTCVVAFGTPAFWIRYFSPSNNTPINTSASNAIRECQAAWDSGGPHLGPIATPVPASHLASDNPAVGQADAQTFTSSLYFVWLNVFRLNLPDNHVLYCWLDQEPIASGGSDLHQGYWNGWASYLDAYNWAGSSGLYPLYPSLYCGPCDVGKNCSTLNMFLSQICYGIWTYQTLPGSFHCTYNLTSHPADCSAPAAKSCQSCGSYSLPPLHLWQYAQPSPGCTSAPGCSNYTSTTANVDMDRGCAINYPDYCFYLSARP